MPQVWWDTECRAIALICSLYLVRSRKGAFLCLFTGSIVQNSSPVPHVQQQVENQSR